MYCPLRGSHSNQLCITSHTKKKPFASYPFIPYSQKSTSCLNSSSFFLTPSLFIQFIASNSSSSIATTEQKKKVIQKCTLDCIASYGWYICDITVSVMIFSPKKHFLILLILIGNTIPFHPPLNFYPIHIQKFFFLPISSSDRFPFSFYLDFCCSVVAVAITFIILPRKIFSTSHPTIQTNHPIYKCFLCYMK